MATSKYRKIKIKQYALHNWQFCYAPSHQIIFAAPQTFRSGRFTTSDALLYFNNESFFLPAFVASRFYQLLLAW